MEAMTPAERENRRYRSRQELLDLAASREEIQAAPATQLRVRATVRIIDDEWVEVRLHIRLSQQRDWLALTPEDSPLLVARRVSRTDRQFLEAYAIGALRQVLEANGAYVKELSGAERRDHADSTEFSYWAYLVGRLSVAVRTNPDMTISVMGLK